MAQRAVWTAGLAMSLGWGLRGFIGGGPLGAMIPGAMVGLVLCLNAGLPASRAALPVMFATLGVAFGGEMTYGQTVGYIVAPPTYSWGLAGLSLKGAVWGALAGAVIAWSLIAGRMGGRANAIAATLLAAATALGWKTINEPKLVYFSNPIDRPRPEIWAGFLLAALALVIWLARHGHGPAAWRLASFGFVFGGVGFGLGGSFQAWGRILGPEWAWVGWWKVMEFTFGFLFGVGLALAAPKLEPTYEAPDSKSTVPVGVALAAVLAAAIIYVPEWIPLRYGYLAFAAPLLALAPRLPSLLWPIAISVPVSAASIDGAEYWVDVKKFGNPVAAYSVAIVVALAFAVMAVRWWNRPSPSLREGFLLITWACVAIAMVKTVLHLSPLLSGASWVQLEFTVMAIALTRLTATMEKSPQHIHGSAFL